jgi:hypothetical protein
MKSLYFSDNQKVGITFDTPRKESNCQNYCNVAKLCYINNNIQDKINTQYKKKLKRNFRLSISKRFIVKISREIINQNWLRIRFFSNGDLVFNDIKKSTIQLDNIFGVCQVCKNNKFWLVTRNCNALMYYFDFLKNTKPENLNIMLSIDGKAQSKPLLNWCKLNKIQPCMITDKKKESNCQASKNHKSCIENNCAKCFDYDKNIRLWFVHGKGNLEKFRKSKNSIQAA